ncbi:MAG: hypothetical protein PVF79_22125 [Desulfobacterales bacterium]
MSFYIKDPDDEYETHEFELVNGQVAFGSDDEASSIPELHDDTETYCNKCSWHGEFKEIIS